MSTTHHPAADGSGNDRQQERKPRFGRWLRIGSGLVLLVGGGIAAGLILSGCGGSGSVGTTSNSSTSVGHGTSPSNVVTGALPSVLRQAVRRIRWDCGSKRIPSRCQEDFDRAVVH